MVNGVLVASWLRHTKSFKGTWRKHTASLARGSAADLVSGVHGERTREYGERKSERACEKEGPRERGSGAELRRGRWISCGEHPRV